MSNDDSSLILLKLIMRGRKRLIRDSDSELSGAHLTQGCCVS